MRRLRGLGFLNLIVFLFLILGAFSTGWYASQAVTLRGVANDTMQPIRYNDPDFPLISPLVSVAIPNATGFPELEGLKKNVQDLITREEAIGKISSVGVYFREPSNAHWFGINENDRFDPGSLIKAPIMLAYLKEAETRPTILQQYIPYDPKKNNALPNALPALLPKDSYSAERLLKAMIVDSDNVAKDALTNNMSSAALQDIFDETNTNFLKDPSGTISPKEYIIILARIYSATYLNRFYSNYAMQLLTQTTYKDGLVAGVPGDVKVGHKYGERGIYEDGVATGIELHDCGIVYAPGNPYYLCVMTKGTDTDAVTAVIRDISAAIYTNRASFGPTK